MTPTCCPEEVVLVTEMNPDVLEAPVILAAQAAMLKTAVTLAAIMYQ